MTPTQTPRTRRTAKTVAAGAVALTAAVALPAFAVDRGSDGAVDASTAGASVDLSTTTTVDPAVAAAERQEAADEWLAHVATLTPGERFDIIWSNASEDEREQIAAYTEHVEQLESFYAMVSWVTGVQQAEAEKAAAAAAARQAAVSTSGASVSGGGVWDRLAQCETGGNWSHPTVSGGFSGGLMFHYATWNAMGGQAYAPTASQASRSQQIAVAERVLASAGWGAWPGCSAKLGLR